ncbi:unnamed protein product [Brachionus calyciflorus]|uniref:Uncharacterized protein n=1 Tax=Brachionus calyciflorus TaxID=104777 RepID=A0A814H8R4_9BILA|nr:unnamed protein product [Brachionus calyciflorus]
MRIKLGKYLVLIFLVGIVTCRSVRQLKEIDHELKPIVSDKINDKLEEIHANDNGEEEQQLENRNDQDIYDRLINREANIPYLVNFNEIKIKQNSNNNNNDEYEEQIQEE